MQGDDGRLHHLMNQVLHSNRDMAEDGRLSVGEQVPIVKLANRIIEIGIEAKASDIHLEPLKDGFRLRYRLDGILWQWPEIFPRRAYERLIGRLKIMANMDTSDRRKPADGHLRYRYPNGQMDIRAASIPVKHGESMVLRLMRNEEELRSIEELGFTPENEALFRRLVHAPSGMVIVSGPMNSGKSSSLYAALQSLNVTSRHIMTIEDPVECELDGVNQVEVSVKTGLSFAAGLRAALRLDANCLMVGEIRDPETAQIAIRAALTGHMLLTTVHAEDSVSTIFRLLEMGVAPFMLAATLSGVVAQRLVRRLCPYCQEEDTEAELDDEEIKAGASPPTFYRGRGCDQCRQTGFLGRLAIHEILTVTPPLKEAILARRNIEEVRRMAKEAGLQTLYKDGLEKALLGLTTLSEVRRVLYGDG
ncbi:MAG: type II/IV secretion system protein [Selenomonadaceae bacterium]|nr:type II/IV secretion system protein [Selenomonadaceae bacterium]